MRSAIESSLLCAKLYLDGFLLKFMTLNRSVASNTSFLYENDDHTLQYFRCFLFLLLKK